MAKRRKTKSKGRRRVGASKLNANNPIIKFGTIALGYFFGDKINAPIEKMVGTKVDGKIIGAGEAGIGALLVFGKGKKTMIKALAGGVLLGAGAKKLMAEFGIGGIGPYGQVPVVAGPYGRVPVIANHRRVGQFSPSHALNGYYPSQSLAGNQRIMSGVGSGSGMTSTSGSEMMN